MDFSESELIVIRRSFNKLEQYVAKRKYQGYDPYDVLLSPFPFRKLGKWPPILAIQFFKRSPLNFRKMMGVPKQWNPKALGLFLQGYAALPASEKNREKCEWLFAKIMELRSDVPVGVAWGYPFPWASPVKFLPAWSPTSVVTGFVVQGLDAYYRKYKDYRALDAMEQACLFVTDGLFHTQKDEDYFISYSTIKPDFCYNASLLAGEIYARTAAHTGAHSYRQMALKTVDTVRKRQKSDGSWNYSENLDTGRQRVQIDFHQGYVLDSILTISQLLNQYTPAIERALQVGFEFYQREQFTREGQAKWRLPDSFPADIHHQAQGVLTGLRYHAYIGSGDAEKLAKSALAYTLQNFQNSKGYFYYRKHKHFTDKTNYMRWANAWMFVALARTIESLDTLPIRPNYSASYDSLPTQ